MAVKGIRLKRTWLQAVYNQEQCAYAENRKPSDCRYACAHEHMHTSTYRVNNSVAHYRMIGFCMRIIFTTILLKYFSTNSLAMMKYLAGVMALGIHHWSGSY